MVNFLTIFLAKLALVVGLWQYVACENCKLMFLIIVLLLFLNDTIDNVTVDDDIKYTKYFSREAYFDDIDDE